MTDPLTIALGALEDANARYLRAVRLHVADLLGRGLSNEEAEEMLSPIDDVEAQQHAIVEKIRALA